MAPSLNAHLSDVCDDRNNNFNLLRLGAAMAVVLSHSFILTGNEPNSIPRGIGYLAVNCFFIMSGFLVCKSAFHHRLIVDFYKSRALRIFPALIVAVIFSAMIIGPLHTNLSLSDYFGDSQTYKFIIKNLTLINGIEHHLPQVFNERVNQSVNAPLWTLVFEIYLYFILGLIAFFTLKRSTVDEASQSFNITVFLLTLICFVLYVYTIAIERFDTRLLEHSVRFTSLFGIGALFYIARKKTKLSPTILSILICILLLSSPWLLLHKTLLYPIVAYVLLYLAYIPKSFFLKFNRLGDYSYGVYIFAYPIQQSIVTWHATISSHVLFISSMVVTLLVAIPCWHVLEKRALKLKANA